MNIETLNYALTGRNEFGVVDLIVLSSIILFVFFYKIKWRKNAKILLMYAISGLILGFFQRSIGLILFKVIRDKPIKFFFNDFFGIHVIPALLFCTIGLLVSRLSIHQKVKTRNVVIVVIILYIIDTWITAHQLIHATQIGM